MKKDDLQAILFVVFVFSTAIAIFTNNSFFSLSAFVSGIIFATLLGSEYIH